MITESLDEKDKQLLLELARLSIERAASRLAPLEINLYEYSPRLRENGATFVTLTKNGNLRGCIGTLEAYQPLVQDVCEHAVAAALSDYRFPPVSQDEVSLLEIEISRLTSPVKLEYGRPEDLIISVRPGIDGVILRDGFNKATFLPQVWEKIPQPEQFFSHLCQKMGAPSDLWRRKILEVMTYQVEEFSEKQVH